MSRRPLPLVLAYYALGALLAALAILPALWLLNVALQPKAIALSGLTPPAQATLDNFAGALGLREAGADLDAAGSLALMWERGLLRPLVNSLLVTLAQAALNVLLAALAAYPLARMRFRGRGTLFVLVLATLMVPEQVITVPLFVTIVGLGLADTLAAVVLPFSVSAFGIYLCRQAFVSIPLDVEEAARIDGADALRTWWHVMLPLARPTLATLAVFSVIGAWSNLLWPLIVLQSPERYTLPVAINQLLSVFGDNVRYAYAASVLALIPMLLMYLAMQRWLQRGLLAGAVKG